MAEGEPVNDNEQEANCSEPLQMTEAESVVISTNDNEQEANSCDCEACKKCCARCTACCAPCTACCKRCYNWISPIFDYANIVTQWLTVVDIGTDISAIIQYFKNDEIPDYFAWILIVVLYLSFRYQTLYIIGLYFDQNTSDDGLFGTITIAKAILSYIPFIGCALAFMNPMFIIADFVGAILFFLGPILVFILSCHCWLIWVKYLFCHGTKPTEKTNAFVGYALTYQRMSVTEIGGFISTWEAIMESAPQTIIGTYVTFTYLNDITVFNTDNAYIVISLIFSACKLLYTVIKLVLDRGHKAGETVQTQGY